jgi:multidrug efflux pump subunit AcrA (membrane-fusion protein)
MFLLSGVARYLFVPMAEAVVFAMLASYILSRTLIPTLAKLPVGTGDAAFKLPSNVLLIRSDGVHVATVEASGHVVMKPVTIGRDYGSDVEIIEGLSSDDNVILSPPDSLTQGAQVRVATPAAGGVAKS